MECEYFNTKFCDSANPNDITCLENQGRGYLNLESAANCYVIAKERERIENQNKKLEKQRRKLENQNRITPFKVACFVPKALAYIFFGKDKKPEPNKNLTAKLNENGQN